LLLKSAIQQQRRDDVVVVPRTRPRRLRAAKVNSLLECHVCDLRHVCGGRCHLPQLRLGQMPHQAACSDRYKESMFRNLVEWGSSA
jgi:radical SAM protein with 4Fe4S-binding SPASM domain